MKILRNHTLATIADEQSSTKRTLQNWYKKAKADHGELGEMLGNTRCFSDYERTIILSYAGMKTSTKGFDTFTTKAVQIEILDDSPMEPEESSIVPTQFNLAKIRGDLNHVSESPLSQANQALAVMDQLIFAMNADIQSQQSQLHQSQDVARQLKEKAGQLQNSQMEYRLRSEMLGMFQNQNKQEVDAALKKLTEISIESS